MIAPMAVDPIAECCERVPALFEKARVELERAAEAGDPVARTRLEALCVEPIATSFVFEGFPRGQLVLHTDRARVEVSSSEAPRGFGYAVSVPTVVALHVIGLAERGELEPGEIARGLVMLGSQRAKELFAQAPASFDCTITDVPVLGSAHARLAFGSTRLPERSDFNVTLSYDELEDAREQHVPPHQLFLAGKMQIDGDAAKAMRFAMTLAQLG
jgi:hypothetical protein